MVGVINPATAGDPPQSLNEYRAAALATNSSSSPAQVQGGVFGAPAPPSNTTSIAPAPAPSSTVSINTNLIGVTLGPHEGGASTNAATASGLIGAYPSSSPNSSPGVSGSISSTVSYGGAGACPASSASATRKG
ncbi:MAG: hypothetical protein M1821_001025 [Bathelium mastoideum]|nr:MAG: hypothetical protein M1821_001025 [Bathelium mastoideum]